MNSIFSVNFACFNWQQAQFHGSQATLTSKKSVSQHTLSEMEDNGHGLKQGEAVNDCNGRVVPRLMIRAPTMEEVGCSYIYPIKGEDILWSAKTLFISHHSKNF